MGACRVRMGRLWSRKWLYLPLDPSLILRVWGTPPSPHPPKKKAISSPIPVHKGLIYFIHSRSRLHQRPLETHLPVHHHLDFLADLDLLHFHPDILSDHPTHQSSFQGPRWSPRDWILQPRTPTGQLRGREV